MMEGNGVHVRNNLYEPFTEQLEKNKEGTKKSELINLEKWIAIIIRIFMFQLFVMRIWPPQNLVTVQKVEIAYAEKTREFVIVIFITKSTTV